MTNSKKRILVVDHLNTKPADLLEYILLNSSESAELLVFYSGFFNQEMRSALPSGTSVEYLSRGFLPTFISKYLYPFVARVKSRLWRESRPIRILYSKTKRLYRLLKWRWRRQWNLRVFYLRKVSWFIYRAISKIAHLMSLMKRLLWKVFKLLIYKPIKVILVFFIAVFIEWPIALVMGLLALRTKREVVAKEHMSFSRRAVVTYYRLSIPLFNKRLEKLQSDSPESSFEYINSPIK